MGLNIVSSATVTFGSSFPCFNCRALETLSAGSAFRGGVEVPRQQDRRVRDALEPGNTAHVNDVRLPFALDDVVSVEVYTERPSAPHGDVVQFRRQRKGFAIFFFLGAPRKDLLHAKELAADCVDLPVAPVVRLVALREDR